MPAYGWGLVLSAAGGGSSGAPAFTANTPTAGTQSSAYSYTFTASGTPAPTFSVTAGSLPAGLALSSGGVLSGTPTAVGSSTFTVTATNTAGTASVSVTMSVVAAAATVTLFGTATPASAASDSPITVGMDFIVDSDCRTTRGRYWRPGTQNDGRIITMELWDASGTVLARGVHGQTSADGVGWVYVPWDSSPILTSGIEYRVAYYDPTGSYPYTSGGATSAIDHAPAHTVATGGRFVAGSSIARPTSTTTLAFFVDLELVSGGTTLFTDPTTHTGVPAGITLTSVSGFHTTVDNQIIDSQLITGTLYIDHQNVVVQRCKLVSPGTSSWNIEVGSTLNAASCKIIDCELDGGTTDQGGVRNQSTGGSSWVGTRLNIHNSENGVRLGGLSTIQDSWIHGFVSHQGDSLAHYDCVECYEGDSNKVLNNFLDLDKTETSCVNFQGDFANVTNSTISGNRMRGGGWIMNLRGIGAHPVTTVAVNNNQLGDSGLGYGAVDATGVTFSGNTDYRTGSNIDTLI